MLKICHIITRFILGGAQENTLASLVGLAERGHDVTLITGPSRGREGNLLEQKGLINSNLPFKFIENRYLVRPINPLFDYLAYKSLSKHFEREKYDIIHTHSSKAGIIGRMAASKVSGKKISKVVHTIHGLAFDKYQSFLKNRIYIAAEKFCAKKSDKIVSVCDTMSEQAVEAGIGSSELFTTIYSGFDLDKFIAARDKKEEIRKKLAIPENTIVLLAIGRLFNMKGAEDFLTVIENLSESYGSPVKGIMIGDGPLRHSLETRAKENLSKNGVMFTGLLPPDEIPDWIAAADIVIHASLREGLARILVQGLAAGKPVVSYDIGGAKEVIADGENGFIVNPGNVKLLTEKVKLLIENKEQLLLLTEGAKETNLTNFSSEVMVEKLEKLYREI
jgi:glycosyltransferase involved in cell wall biosynthesis